MLSETWIKRRIDKEEHPEEAPSPNVDELGDINEDCDQEIEEVVEEGKFRLGTDKNSYSIPRMTRKKHIRLLKNLLMFSLRNLCPLPVPHPSINVVSQGDPSYSASS